MATFLRTGFESFWYRDALNIGPGRCEIHLVFVADVDLVAAAAVAKALLVGLVEGQVLERFFTVNLMPKAANLVV